jgi:hypothetical protein
MSDVDIFCDFDVVIDLDVDVANGGLDLREPERARAMMHLGLTH